MFNQLPMFFMHTAATEVAIVVEVFTLWKSIKLAVPLHCAVFLSWSFNTTVTSISSKMGGAQLRGAGCGVRGGFYCRVRGDFTAGCGVFTRLRGWLRGWLRGELLFRSAGLVIFAGWIFLAGCGVGHFVRGDFFSPHFSKNGWSLTKRLVYKM